MREGEKEERIGLYRETKSEAETEGDSNWAKERKRGPVGGPTISKAPNYLVLHSLWDTVLDRKPWPGRWNS